MAITRRLPWPKLLFLFVWLCLALDTNRAARVSSDQFAFPSESDNTKPTIASDSTSLGIEPRIVLETTRICPNGTTLTVKDRCRKIA